MLEELCLGERRLRSAVPWISTMPPRVGQHEVGVCIGGEVLLVVEVEHRLAAD